MSQNSLKATYQRKYRKPSETPGKPGRQVFVYAISGKPEDVEAYQDAQADNLVLDDVTGVPLMFSITLGHKPVMPVIQTGGFNGRPIQFRLDTSEMDNIAQLASQYADSPVFAQAIATQALAGLNLNFTTGTSTFLNTGEADGSLNDEAGENAAEAGAEPAATGKGKKK